MQIHINAIPNLNPMNNCHEIEMVTEQIYGTNIMI